MKKTTLNDFDARVVVNNDHFNIKSDDYLNSILINKIVVLPLRKLQGNIEKKTGMDSVIIVLSGSGSMEVNNVRLPIKSGDVVLVKAAESFSIINDSLSDMLECVSLYQNKK